MKKSVFFVLISLFSLIYGCNTINIKGTTYKDTYGDPHSEAFNKFIESKFAVRSDKILFKNIADITFNVSSIDDYELSRINPFSIIQSFHGIVAVSQDYLIFITHDNTKNTYSDLFRIETKKIKKATLEEFGPNNFSILINEENPSNNNLIQIINEESQIVDSDRSHAFFDLLEKLI